MLSKTTTTKYFSALEKLYAQFKFKPFKFNQAKEVCTTFKIGHPMFMTGCQKAKVLVRSGKDYCFKEAPTFTHGARVHKTVSAIHAGYARKRKNSTLVNSTAGKKKDLQLELDLKTSTKTPRKTKGINRIELSAIKLLKERGYKISRPITKVVEFEEI